MSQTPAKNSRRFAGIGFLLLLFHCSFAWHPIPVEPALAQGPTPNLNSATSAKPVPANHPLAAVLRLAKESRNRIQSVKDYECQFVKRDVVNGKVHAHTTWVKFRRQPMSVYLRFDKPKAGREVIYVDGQNGGKLLAHEGGLFGLVGTVSLLPNSRQAMSESRHPITEFGLENLVNGAIAQWEREAQFAAQETEAKFYPKAKLYEMECQVIETRHPVARREFPFYMTRLYLDNKTLFPVRMEQYAFPQKAGEAPPLIEEYTFHQIQTNQGYTDRDFDTKNPNYGY